MGCDGCSGSVASEIGAGLAAYFAAEALCDLVQTCPVTDETSANLAAVMLYERVMAYLRDLIAIQPHGRHYLECLDAEQHNGHDVVLDNDVRLQRVYNWILDNLLFTMVGAYVGQHGILAFQRGDGGCCVDDTPHTEDYRNVPPYLAYAFVPRCELERGEAHLRKRNHSAKLPPPGFTTTYTPDARRVALFSDGMPMQHVDSVWSLVDPVDQWEFRRNRVQKAARQWQRNGELHDDLFLGVFVRETVGD